MNENGEKRKRKKTEGKLINPTCICLPIRTFHLTHSYLFTQTCKTPVHFPRFYHVNFILLSSVPPTVHLSPTHLLGETLVHTFYALREGAVQEADKSILIVHVERSENNGVHFVSRVSPVALLLNQHLLLNDERKVEEVKEKTEGRGKKMGSGKNAVQCLTGIMLCPIRKAAAANSLAIPALVVLS